MSVDLSVQVGSVRLASPVMTASGTAGYGMELAPYFEQAVHGRALRRHRKLPVWPSE